MSSSLAHDYLVNGIASAKAKEIGEARRLLERALTLDLDEQERIEALYWLSEVARDQAEQRDLLESILALDMSDGRARRKLALLDGQVKSNDFIDPDIPQPIPQENVRSANAKRFVCPQCGGKMVFRPDGQSLVCEYCETKKTPQPTDTSEGTADQDFFVAMATKKGHFNILATRIYYCKGCGASFLFSPTELSRNCPHCGSAHVIKNQNDEEVILPTGIIPFQTSESDAKRILRYWLEEKFGKKPVRVKYGAGAYLPVWVFEIAGPIPYRYRIYKEKKWVECQDEEYLLKGEIVIPATLKLEPMWEEQTSRYDLKKAVEYNDEYLSNWPAETYQISVADASLKAREIAFQDEKNRIAEGLSGQFEDLFLSSSKLRVDSYKLILLPVWIITYVHLERGYRVTINGQTGEVIGEMPSTGIRKWINNLLGNDRPK